MKIGLSVKIDVTKIPKEQLIKGKKGTYLDMTTFIDTEEADQYGNHGAIQISMSKEDREMGVKPIILGNGKVFWKQESIQAKPKPKEIEHVIEDDDIPF